MDVVRIGLIGYGGMGSNHAGYLFAGDVPGAKLAAVSDSDPSRLEEAERRFGDSVVRFADAEALIDSGMVDAVMIATPHYLHPPIGIKALEKGLHVLSEKPVGVYGKQVRELNEAAAKSTGIFAVMFNQRCRPVHQKLKDLIASGELGEIRRTNWIITSWFRTQFYYDAGGWRATWEGEGGGVLLNQCPHNLDLWQWVCGMPTRVRAFCSFGKYHNIEVEDDVTAYVEYENGATGLFVTTTGEAPGTNRLEITGDRGKIILEDGKLEFWRTRESVSAFLRETQAGFATPECWRCDVPSGGGIDQEHKEVTRRWVRAIQGAGELVAKGEEGMRSLQLSNAMLLSAWTDEWVDIPVDEDLFYEKLQEKIASSTVEKKTVGKTMDVDGTF
ncbi:MAG: Gfo/Idh/MocA family oxidoreductase [Candidatus Pacebacteria bacterium]|nr:Gfo/Idh/MocA family oxidoreductase [Candidatus Paceibacterota bacterium]